MSKTQKELAFLYDLYITKDWTERFTTFLDTNFKLPKKGKFLYVNAGTANHALELIEKMDRTAEIICVSENEEVEKIAKAKVELMKANIKFKKLNELESENFDAVIADLSFVKSTELSNLLDEIVFLTKKKGKIAFFMPTAGSFGDIFSFLWETFLGVELIEKSGEIERLIGEIPTISHLEELAETAEIKDGAVHTEIEIFDYETGDEFIKSSLLEDFLFPDWLDFLNDKERKKALKKMAQLIDIERGKLTFRFSVKNTLIVGEKS